MYEAYLISIYPNLIRITGVEEIEKTG